MTSFSDLGVDARLCTSLTEAGIETPFPIQVATLPDALAGRDICAMAPTGSGKTLAFGITLLQMTAKAGPRQPSALVLVPTRELAQQVANALVPFGKSTGRWIMAFYGGAGMPRQIEALRRGVDIAVATPGRLTDLVKRGDCDLSNVEYVVVDEADRMADMGFMPQIRWLLDWVSPKRQIQLFSATLDGDVGILVKEYLNDPVRHEVAGQHVDGEGDADAATRAPQYRILVRNDNKPDIVAQLGAVARRTVVFAKNRFSTERIADQISERGSEALYLHGGMSQYARTATVKSWAAGHGRILVATDVAARGLHVDCLDLVVHYDAPQDEKDFIHRSGRTARAGNRGVVVNLVRKEMMRATEKMEQRLGVSATTVELPSVLEELREIVDSSPEQEAKIAADRSGWGAGRTDRPERERPSYGDRPRYGDRDRGGFGDRPRQERPRFGDRERSFGGGRPSYGERSSSSDRPSYGDRSRYESRDRAPYAERPRRDDADRAQREERPASDLANAPAVEPTGFVGDVAADRPAFNDRPRFENRDRPTYGDRPVRDDRTRFEHRDRPAYGDRPVGDRPAYGDRPSSGDRPRFENRDRPRLADRDRPTYADRGRPSGGARAPFGDRPGVGDRDRPAFNDRSRFEPRFEHRDRPAYGDRPVGDRPEHGDRRTFADRPPFENRDRPASGDRPVREDRPRFENRDRSATGDRPPRRDRAEAFGGERPIREPKADFDGEGSTRIARFDEAGKPLNRKARRAMQFGATS